MGVYMANIEEDKAEPGEGKDGLIVSEGDGRRIGSLARLEDPLRFGEVPDEIDPDKRTEESHANERAQGDEFQQGKSNERVEHDSALGLFGEGLGLSAKGVEEMRLPHPGGERVKVENLGGHLSGPHLIGCVGDQ